MVLKQFLATLASGSRRRLDDRLVSAARALNHGESARAVQEYQAILAAHPRHAGAWNDLGIAHRASGEPARAREAFQRAATLEPNLAPARLNLGHALFEDCRDYDAAEAEYRAALAADGSLGEARRKLALVLYEQGLAQQALDALDLPPACLDSEELEYRLFFRNAVPGHDPREHFREHVAWAKTQPPLPSRPAARPGNRHLRVGYVSADFREHATAPFVLPILEGHDRNSIDVYCYSAGGPADAVTQVMMSAGCFWRDIAMLDDRAAAALIVADELDLLVDLSGHSRGNRLGVLALRPARVQATYLGYLNTSGLVAVDYRITDSLMDPPGASDDFHVERLLRLGSVAWCYRAPVGAGEPGEPPSAANGYVTFGSFNHPAKLNDEVLKLWARVLDAVPTSRLAIGAMPPGGTSRRIAGFLAGEGIAPDRLRFLPRLGRAGFLDALSSVDVALDPFPYCGGSTTCDLLWMGVPVVTLAGDFGFARSCAAILQSVGLSGLVAGTQDEYVAHAAAAAHARSTRELRATLRQRIEASPLMDERAFVRRLENAYREIVRSIPSC